jgi:predicted MPP superfamily phosphohydrolase
MTSQLDLTIHAVNLLVLAGLLVSTTASVLTRSRNRVGALSLRDLPPSLFLLLFCLADGALLWTLPHIRLSFSPEINLPLITSIFVRLLVFCALSAVSLPFYWRKRQQLTEVQFRPALSLFLILNLSFSLVQVYAYVIEPLLVETTELSFTSGDLDPAAPPVHIVHLTDTHIERSSFRETSVIRQVNALQPDIIVLTGDYLNLSYLSDPTSAAHFRQFVAQLQAPYGIYAVRGSVESRPESMARLLAGTNVVWLEQESITITVRGQAVTLVGVACSHRQPVDVERLAQAMAGIPASAFTVLLYHSPDLIREAVEHQVDLYLGGHTHGGQLCLPFYGAIATASRYGKQYVSGLFTEGGTKMYISRGLGFEGGSMPRARFLCRPEVVSLELEGEK